MLYDFYLEKQVLLDKFDMILKKLYKMPEAELSVNEGAIFVLFSLFLLFELFHLPKTCSQVNETSSERLRPVVANNLNIISFRIEKRDWARSK